MVKLFEKHPILSICGLVALMLLPNISSLDVSIMEARNFITAREMITDGNWLLTSMNGEPRYQKPPLPTWLAAISSFIFGMKNLFGLRLPAVLMIMIIGSFIYKLSNSFLNKEHSFINALIVITSFYVIGIIIEAPWDIFTHGFMLIAIYHLFQFFEKEHRYTNHILISGLCVGLSFMCKGPISMYALLLPFLLAYGFTFKYKQIKSKLLPILSILIISAIIGLWWFTYVRVEDAETFKAIAEKETANWSSYNVRPFYYYWSFFTQSGLWTIPAFISLLYPYLKSRVSNLKAYRFSLLWTLLAVVLLSIVPEKKSRYLMPVLIPLAINIGFYIEYLIRSFKTLNDKKETFPVYFNFGLIGFIGIVFPILAFWFLKDNLTGYWFWFIAASVFVFIIGILILKYLKQKNIMNVFLLTVTFFSVLLMFGLPLSKVKTSSNYNSISDLKEESINVYAYNYVSPEIIWLYGDKIPIVNSNNFPEDKTFGLLVSKITEDFEALTEFYSIEKVSTFDLNRISTESKKHNKRLLSHYYIFTKK